MIFSEELKEPLPQFSLLPLPSLRLRMHQLDAQIAAIKEDALMSGAMLNDLSVMLVFRRPPGSVQSSIEVRLA